eukprot:EG_transcript_32427
MSAPEHRQVVPSSLRRPVAAFWDWSNITADFPLPEMPKLPEIPHPQVHLDSVKQYVICWAAWAGALVASALAGLLLLPLCVALLGCIGFGTGGIVAGSLAATCMSACFPIAQGSLYASVQSFAAVGALYSPPAMVVTSTIGFVVGAFGMLHWGCHVCASCGCH